MCWLSYLGSQKSAGIGTLPVPDTSAATRGWESWPHCHGQPKMTCTGYLMFSLSWNVNTLTYPSFQVYQSKCTWARVRNGLVKPANGLSIRNSVFSGNHKLWIPVCVEKWIITSRFVWILHIPEGSSLIPSLIYTDTGKAFQFSKCSLMWLLSTNTETFMCSRRLQLYARK